MTDKKTAEELANIEKRYSHVDDIWTLAIASCSTIAKDVHQLIATIREGDEKIRVTERCMEIWREIATENGRKIYGKDYDGIGRALEFEAKDAEIAELKAEVGRLKRYIRHAIEGGMDGCGVKWMIENLELAIGKE
jgi:hypothetical protein